MKRTIEHHDIFGRLLQVGDFVAAPYWNRNLGIFSVVKLTPKMVKIKRIGARAEQSAYPVDVIKVDGPEVTCYILKNSKG
jgi:hypothetical protein